MSIPTRAVHLLAVVSFVLPCERAGAQVALGTQLEFPNAVAFLPDGSLLVAERRAHRVRRLDLTTGRFASFAGTGERGFSGDGGAAARAALACPDALDVDALGNVFVADRCNGRIRRIDARSGVITTVAGNGGEGPSPDGRAVQMALAGVFYVRVANDDALLFTDTEAHLVRELDLRSGQVRTVAGNGMQGFTGDGGPALEASLSRPHVALRLANGDLLIGDSFNHRVRVVDAASGTIRTIAGNGEEAPAVGGAMATESPLMYFGDIHEQPDGSLIWSEWGSSQVVRLDRTTGRLEVVAGNTTFDRADADGPAAGRALGSVVGMARDARGRFILAAASVGLVRRLDLDAGTIETLAGVPPR